MTAVRVNTFPLAFPFEFDGKEISEVTMRRAKGRDLERMEAAGKDFAAGMVTLSCLTDLPVDAIREMDSEDIAMLSEQVPDFLAKPRAPAGGE
jgi:hypothetical protein